MELAKKKKKRQFSLISNWSVKFCRLIQNQASFAQLRKFFSRPCKISRLDKMTHKGAKTPSFKHFKVYFDAYEHSIRCCHVANPIEIINRNSYKKLRDIFILVNSLSRTIFSYFPSLPHWPNMHYEANITSMSG